MKPKKTCHVLAAMFILHFTLYTLHSFGAVVDTPVAGRVTIAVAGTNACGVIARMGADSVVRVTSRDGKAEYAKVVFELPVEPDWKVLSRSGEGLKAQNAWAPVGEGKTVPWYILLHDGAKTYGFGVKVQPRAMCSWRVEKGKIELLLDLRAAGQPLELGERTLEACEVVRCESAPAENAYATGRRLCALMCPHPRPLKEPMIGFNDWYAAYGRNTAKVFRAMLNSQPTTPNSQLITHNSQPCFSGIYPHLAMFNDEGECGTGAVVPWAGSLWVVTYGPHCPAGSSDKLYQISPDLTRVVRPESVGGTPANRLIHRETNQLLIGPYVIDAKGGVRAVPVAKMPGRLTGAARHLTDPANKVYVATMDNGLYSLDMRTLAVKTLQRDHNGISGKIWGARGIGIPLPPDWNDAVDNTLPGSHTKGMCSGFGRMTTTAGPGTSRTSTATRTWCAARS